MAQAEVTLSSVLGDHMLVQRNQPIHLWGHAEPGESVRVQMQHDVANTVADPLGRWDIYLPARKAGGPFDLSVRGSHEIQLHDVMVGDVWVASGQSNMEFGMKSVMHAEAELQKAAQYDIRILHVGHAVSEFPLSDLKEPATWQRADKDKLPGFSAVAYLFARQLEDHEHIPVGIIQSTWGGTPAEAWTSLEALSKTPALMPVFQEWSEILQGRTEEELRASHPKGSTPAPALRDLNAWHPGNLFHAMIAPLTPFPIKGVIWYQGESNTAEGNYSYYQPLFRTLIEDWRAQWKIGDFPFLYVQIANVKASSPRNKWAEIRDAQRRSLVLKNTGMAVTIDLGEAANVHPKNKQDVADRLYKQALHIAYGETLEPSGPLYRSSFPTGDAIKILFDHAERLVLRASQTSMFQVAGDDGVFRPATASIDNGMVVLRSAEVANPRHARYAWLDNPEAVLYNGAGLPASPFCTD